MFSNMPYCIDFCSAKEEGPELSACSALYIALTYHTYLCGFGFHVGPCGTRALNEALNDNNLILKHLITVNAP